MAPAVKKSVLFQHIAEKQASLINEVNEVNLFFSFKKNGRKGPLIIGTPKLVCFMENLYAESNELKKIIKDDLLFIVDNNAKLQVDNLGNPQILMNQIEGPKKLPLPVSLMNHGQLTS